MTYFADLTPYTFNKSRPEPDTLNIGWLEGTQPFSVGETPQEFRERLWMFQTAVIWPMRGFHFCTICPDRKLATAPLKLWKLGTAEIRVFYQGRVYAAPNLICHYVSDHHYQPPQEFIEAVLYGDLPGSRTYLKQLQKLNPDCYFLDHETGQIRRLPKTLWARFKEKFFD